MSRKRLQKRRLALWIEDPRCHWCGQLTVLPTGEAKVAAPPENMATIDHLRSRFHHERGRGTQPATVLACWRCNNDRCKAEQEQIALFERRRRSQQHRRTD